MSRPPFCRHLMFAALFAAISLPAGAQEGRWALCPPAPPAPELPATTGKAVDLEATVAETEGERSIFSGDVVILREGQRLSASRVEYDRAADVLELSGQVELQGPASVFTGERGRVDLNREEGFLEGARYRVYSGHVSGEAERVEYRGDQHISLTGATYTTCPPGSDDWVLHASRFEIDRPTNTGEAYNVTVRLGGVPVAWLPYMNFPLEGRKSGFLLPSYGSSERNGADVSVPWYWNIAPNRDATITPRLIGARGGMLQSEVRYLDSFGGGMVRADYLPRDKLFDGDRSHFYLTYGARLSERWRANVLYQRVSDPHYLEDIDNTLANASATHLERTFDLTYDGQGWNFLGRVQDFQPLVADSAPYTRRPQLAATGAWRAGLFDYGLATRYDQFAHDSLRPTGARIDFYPGLSLPLQGDAWFLTPRIAARHTQYDLDNAPGNGHSARSLPIASLDGGLFFDRAVTLRGEPLVHTLEPRFYYLKVPYQDQADLPVFDTKAMTFSFAQLFREMRYSGPDRIGDADQLTVALTTRLLSDTSGHELLRASVGQIHHFADPRVTLPGEVPLQRGYSDLAAELAAQPLRALELSAAARWDPDRGDAQESAVRASYAPEKGKLIDAVYRYRDAGTVMNRDLLIMWPVSSRWRGLWRWYYDLVAERTLESVVGVEYESCCWSVQFIGRDRPVIAPTGQVEPDRSWYITLELKGLGRLGRSLENIIQEGTVGY